jgi:hypothetical protein
MVIFNSEVLICKNSLEKSIKIIMNEVMQQYFDNEILLKTTEEKKDIMNKIIKEKENKIKENHFWYYNSSPNVCTFIHKRGKKQGFMCHKKKKELIVMEKKQIFYVQLIVNYIFQKRRKLKM